MASPLTVHDFLDWYGRTQGETLRGKPYSYLMARAFEMLADLRPCWRVGDAREVAVDLVHAVEEMQ